MPFSISYHTMIQTDLDSIYIIGGRQDCYTTFETWTVNINNDFEIKEGPPLNIAREGHSCGKMIIDGKCFVVIAGGWNEDTVELLDLSSDNGWILGNVHFFLFYKHRFLRLLDFCKNLSN